MKWPPVTPVHPAHSTARPGYRSHTGVHDGAAIPTERGMSLALVLALSLSSTGSTSPLEPSLYESHLSVPQGALVESLKSGPGQQLAHGVRLVVGGSILGTVGAVGIVGGLLLLSNAAISDGSERTVSTVLGWTFLGAGALFAVIGVPLVIAGVITMATSPLARRDRVALTVSRNGNLAVTF